MNFEVIWSKFAEKQLDEIFEYYEKNASERVAIEMVEGLLNEPDRLIKDPFIGQKEVLLKERKILYRYLVFKNYKIIYSVDEKNNLIKIADIFATKQKPNKLERLD
ncbi:type II toxin-antitoxin system RelE/ParE family toxin [Zunongwangia sp. F363]|uniref:Type II toxin-antitoxin system RelE/ParE family toxin n=1 Tax=Autumnicola tepida TaxID=3075595 RepID=A0ABU3C8R1_9FLAO|nr:type II toxin-antitoxin system RelE/ParE family toxin [Zunongwangia sp. F363]MDT0642728.1 type II toxin-antitoxin system RelE/ParE family toxin [Zunongwangia sp. F363]